MSSEPQDKQAVESQTTTPPNNAESSSQAAPAKRSAADDEIQFISSNPVKKRRQSEQKPTQTMAQPATQPAQNPPESQDAASAASTMPANRHHSTGNASHSNGPAMGSTLETRGTSLPVLEKFTFPQPLPPVARAPRMSEAISPKHLPQALPSPPAEGMAPRDGMEANQHIPSVPGVAPPQNSVRLDQISCLNFNGVPTNAPGFDAGRILSADGGIMTGLGVGSIASPAATMPSFSPMASPNGIPFTMYSTGNIMPMPQAQYMNHPAATFTLSHMQSQPRQYGVPVVDNAKHRNSGKPPTGQPSYSRVPSPTPGGKAPCLHCARIRQENLLRRAQASTRSPGHAAQPHTPPTHHTRSRTECSSTLKAADKELPSPVTTKPGPAPRSAPANGQSVQGDKQQQQQPQPPQQQQPFPFPPQSRPVPSPPSSLILDIAETLQATFPYAQVAARHGIPQARVVELVSGMVRPLLRGSVRTPIAGIN